LIFDFYKSQKFGAIIYPAVQSEYRGNNIAMKPELVDKFLSFFLGAEFELVKNESKINIENILGLKIGNGSIVHFDLDQKDQSESQTFPI